MELEFHQLDQRYEHLRARRPEVEKRLLASLAEVGQQVPVVVIAGEGAERFVVVDGYKRIRALRRLSRDSIRATRWDLGEFEALVLGRLMRAAEHETALEQGWLLRELQERFSVSQDELARRFDRSVSWVSRRLALVRELPGTVQQHVIEGKILAQTAMKVLVPLARAKRADCERLASAIAGKGLSVRDAADLYAAYREGRPEVREIVLSDPLLALKARHEALVEPPHEPQPSVFKDLEIVSAVARRALRRLCEGKAIGLAACEWEEMGRAHRQARRDITRLGRQITKERNRAGSQSTSRDPGTPSEGS